MSANRSLDHVLEMRSMWIVCIREIALVLWKKRKMFNDFVLCIPRFFLGIFSNPKSSYFYIFTFFLDEINYFIAHILFKYLAKSGISPELDESPVWAWPGAGPTFALWGDLERPTPALILALNMVVAIHNNGLQK